jgi:hypothetical protein
MPISFGAAAWKCRLFANMIFQLNFLSDFSTLRCINAPNGRPSVEVVTNEVRPYYFPLPKRCLLEQVVLCLFSRIHILSGSGRCCGTFLRNLVPIESDVYDESIHIATIIYGNTNSWCGAGFSKGSRSEGFTS